MLKINESFFLAYTVISDGKLANTYCCYVTPIKPYWKTTEHYSFADHANVHVFTVNSTKPQLVWRETITSVIGCNGISLVHSSVSQWCQCDLRWSVRDIHNVHTIPILLWQTLVHRFLVEQMQTVNTNSLAALDADVSAVIRHDTAVCIQHRSTRTFWTTASYIKCLTTNHTTLNFLSNLLCSLLTTDRKILALLIIKYYHSR